MSEVPNSAPAAMPRTMPLRKSAGSSRLDTAISTPLRAITVLWTAISVAAEAWCGAAGAAVSPRTASPIAVTRRPVRCRRPRPKPKNRSARIAMKTRPPEMTACTVDSGASDKAPTCNSQAPNATSQPTVHHLEPKRPVTLSTGWRARMTGAAAAPRCLSSIARLPAIAQPAASARPAITRPFPCDRLTRGARARRSGSRVARRPSARGRSGREA